MLDGLRLAFSTLTALPVGPPADVSRPTVGRAMASAPAVGVVLGGAAAAVGAGLFWWTGSSLVGALAAVGTLAVLTRGLHLDGLADTADGLGSAKPAADALRVMKASDIGPFGVITLILVLLGQILLVSASWHRHGTGYAAAALIAAAATGRLCVAWACRSPVTSARSDGLGAWVAGAVSRAATATATLSTLAVATILGVCVAWRSPLTLVRWPLAVVGGIAASALLLRHTVRRFGGITGDVLGALVETGFTAALLVLAH